MRSGLRAILARLGITVFAIGLGGYAAAQPVRTTPTVEELMVRAQAKPRPRSIDVSVLRANGFAAPQLGREVVAQILKFSREALPEEPQLDTALKTASPERFAQMRNVQNAAFGEEEKILLASLAWLIAGDRAALNEARRRALNIAHWPAQGATSFRAHDQAGRSVAWTLTLFFDWLYAELTEDEHKLLLTAITPRITEMLSANIPYGLDDGRSQDRNPFDSHGAVTLARVVAMCTVLLDQNTVFEKCTRNLMPRYLARQVPWGGEDGGYANGTSYAQWDMLSTHFVVWDLLKQMVDVDLWQTPSAQGYGRFLAYFLPPGTPSGVFGDETEKNWRGVWATQAKAYAAHLPSPLANWYARNQFGEKATQLALLLAPLRDWNSISGALPQGTANGILLPSIGWVAMHSTLGDRARTSVYFKSSSYGSYNHSHADQNSFVIHARGRILAADSGYYDFYGSPHWKGWYKQTLAHNAITFDGGQGQLHDTMAAKGKITKFANTAAFDLVTGDATTAYGGALIRAVRSMVYVRPDALLVFDALASATPRTWEWNIHALSQMKINGARTMEITQDGVRLCIQLLDAPEGGFSQADRFTAEPNGRYPNQWHGRFSTLAKSTSTKFLALLDVECHRPEVTVRLEGEKRMVSLGGKQVVFDESGGVEVAP